MRWSLPVFRVGETTVRLHITFLLLLGWLGLQFTLRGGGAAALANLGYILALFGSVLLHEFGHVFAARRFGVRTPDITLLPIGGVARLERIPEEPRQELIVAAAGPLVNVILAALIWAAGAAVGRPVGGPDASLLGGTLAGRILWANLLLVGFNLLPAFPMDGGRILRALLALRMDFGRATQTAAAIGQGMAFLFGFVGLLFNPLLAFVALFVYLGAQGEASAVQMREATEGIPVVSAMLTDFATLSRSTPLAQAAERILQTAQRAFPVVDPAGDLVGLLTGEDIIRGLKDQGGAAPVSEVMQAPPPRVYAGAALSDALDLMRARQCRPLLVVDRQGEPVGVLTCDQVGQFVTVQAAVEGVEAPAWRAG